MATEQARFLRSYSAVGRTQDMVACPCGEVNAFYRWSWAGHGKARCGGCKRWIMYATLEVEPSKGRVTRPATTERGN